MKILSLLMGVAFAIMFIVRVVEMSIVFDWIDVVWTIIFLLGLMISTIAYSLNKDEEW